MNFPYQSYPVRAIDGHGTVLIPRPSIPIRLIGPGGEALAFGLLDTGADDTLIPSSLQGPLGLEPIPGLSGPIAGIGGSAIIVHFVAIDLDLRRGRTSHRWSARVGLYPGSRVILGQSGVLEHFLAGFNHRRRIATLRPAGVLPAPSQLAP